MRTNPFDLNVLNVNADLKWRTLILGGWLRALRKKRGCSLGHLQTLSGVDMAEIHRIEKGEQECRIQSLLRLCAALGTTPGFILDRSLESNRTEIQKRILGDSEFIALRSRLTFATPERIASLTDALINQCQIASVLVRCSDPISFMKNLPFPLAELQVAFADFAQRIAAIGEGVERASILYGLLSNPVRELRSQGLLPDVLLTEDGLAKLPHGAPDGFDMNAKPEPGDSYAIIEKPDGDFEVRPILPDNK